MLDSGNNSYQRYGKDRTVLGLIALYIVWGTAMNYLYRLAATMADTDLKFVLGILTIATVLAVAGTVAL